jgi:hypothetical protein
MTRPHHIRQAILLVLLLGLGSCTKNELVEPSGVPAQVGSAKSSDLDGSSAEPGLDISDDGDEEPDSDRRNKKPRT